MKWLEEIKNSILAGTLPTKDELMTLWDAPSETLFAVSDELRQTFCGDAFDLCGIINGKSGRCPEDCRYCAQSSKNHANPHDYPLMDGADLAREAQRGFTQGLVRFSVVTSGKKLTDGEVATLGECYRSIRSSCPALRLCASHGLLEPAQFLRLKASGITRYHNNLETSRRYFPHICTTHTYDDKLLTIARARSAGLEICSGGIIGMGETREDRVDLALELRQLDVHSIPLNILNPIPGTPLEEMPRLSDEEVCRTAAIFRFAVPHAAIRMAGGRGQLADRGQAVFRSGANAAITGDMLTTSGVAIQDDIALLTALGYQIRAL